MTTYYVGIGGNDGNAGTSWAQRFLTLNGAEDEPVAAGDTVYVGPGVYREQLTCDISGSSGNPITYIADVTGEHTDGVGGIVRITGSNNDTTVTRSQTIAATSKNYRTFRGFRCDMTSGNAVYVASSDTWIIEDCHFGTIGGGYISNSTNITFRRCLFQGHTINNQLWFSHTSPQDDSGNVVQNCIFYGGAGGIIITRVGGITVKNCAFVGRFYNALAVVTALTVGQTITVNNCIFYGASNALNATAVGEIVEDYNAFFANSSNRTNTNTGANSNTYPPLFNTPLLHAGASQAAGFKFPWWFGELSEWSQIRAITGTGTAATDLFGLTRPATAAKLSWGPIQYVDAARETITTRTGGVSIKLEDAGRHQMFVPVTAVSTTISVYVYREADYTGTNPQMVIKQPGQADDTTTDAGAASQWNELTTTLTPAAEPPYVIVELVSNNTSGPGLYSTNDVFFDDLTVS